MGLTCCGNHDNHGNDCNDGKDSLVIRLLKQYVRGNGKFMEVARFCHGVKKLIKLRAVLVFRDWEKLMN